MEVMFNLAKIEVGRKDNTFCNTLKNRNKF